jgi:hypothetical protein
MRSLHADLTAAQKQTRVKPVLQVTISDRHAGVRRPHPELLYDGSETLTNNALTVTTLSGHIIRVYHVSGVVKVNVNNNP